MQQLLERHGVDQVRRALRFAGIRLKAQPATADLGRQTDALRAKVVAVAESAEQAFEERVAATASIGYLDSVVDGLVMSVAREVNTLVEGKTDDERYQTLFPTAPSKAVASLAGDGQNRFVHGLMERIESDERFVGLRPRLPAMKIAQDDLETALRQREQLYVPEQRTAADLQAAIDEAKRFYNQLAPRLTLLFPNKPRFVESFFVRFGKAGKQVESAVEGEDEGGGEG